MIREFAGKSLERRTAKGLTGASVTAFGLALGAASVGYGTDGLTQTAYFILAATMLAVALGSITLLAIKGVTRRGDHIEAGFFAYEYEEAKGENRHLERVCDLGRRAIGPSHTSVDLLQQRLEVNDQVLRVVGRRHAGGEIELCAFTLVYPLSADADLKIADQTIRSGFQLAVDHFLPPADPPQCLYVGMILGIDTDAKAYVKSMLRRDLLAALSHHPSIVRVYGRPASKGGKRLLEQLRFEPVGDPGDIWAIEAPALRRRLRAAVV